MTLILKQSTSIDIRMGPFVDSTDGVTPETGITLGAADQAEVLKANGAATTAMAGTFAAVTGSDGWYDYTVATGDVDTVGEVVFVVQDSSICLPVFVKAYIVEEAIYDAMFASAATGLLPANVTQISGDSTAADNLEAMYDGTGYIADTAPASRSQVDSIGSASGGALNYAATGDNVLGALKGVTFVGVQTSGTYADTDAEDGIYHQITHSGNAIDIVYSYFVGANSSAIEIDFFGYLNSSNDVITIQAYDFTTLGWDTRKTLTGTNGSTNQVETIKLLAKHTGTTGADIGTAYVRFVTSGQTSPVLFTDEVLLAAVNTSQSRGFLENSVWIDTVNGTSGTGEGIGTASSPSDNVTDARTIADAQNLNAFIVQSGSNLGALGQEFDGYQFFNQGTGAIVALDGQSLTSTLFSRMRIQGNDDGSNTQRTRYDECRFDGNTLGDFTAFDCAFGGDVVFAQASNQYTVYQPRQVSSAPATLDFALLTSVELIMQYVSCDVELKQLAATSEAFIHGDGGEITLNANCTGGTVTIYGNFTVTDNSGGAVTIVDGGRIDTAQITASVPTAVQNRAEMDSNSTQLAKLGTPAADISADIATRMAESSINTTGGAIDVVTDVTNRVTANTDQIDGVAAAATNLAASAGTIVIGAAETGTLSTTQMSTNLSEATDDHYNGRIIIWTSGVLATQATNITDYTGTAGVLTFTAVTEAPSNTDTFVIV